MVENTETEVVRETNTKISGLSIAALVLGIVSMVLWCMWIVSIPCSILALVFGIMGLKKPGKEMAITGLVTGAIALTIWTILFLGAFMFGFMEGMTQDFHDMHSSYYLD